MSEQLRFHGVLFRREDDLLVTSAEDQRVFELMLPANDAVISLEEGSEGSDVSVVGRLLPEAGTYQPLVAVEHLTRHDLIATRAYQIFQSQESGSALDNWLRAENGFPSIVRQNWPPFAP
jgi:hypothetical protein